MPLRDKIVGKCQTCGGTGYVNFNLCDCEYKFRAYNRMLNKGFNEVTLDFVNLSTYQIPQCDSGKDFLDYYLTNPWEVINKGLSLYLFSKERGRGKTTLAHYLVYQMAKLFMRTENYDYDRSFGFDRADSLFNKMRTSDYEGWKSTIWVLDDLGTEDRTNWKKELVNSYIQQIFQYRRDNKFPTIITSNFKPSDLSNLYEGTVDSLLEINAAGIIGGSLFRSVELGGGEDLRLAEENSSWPV